MGSEFSLSSDKKDSESSDDNIDGDKMVSNEGSNEPRKTWVIEWKKGFNTSSEENWLYTLKKEIRKIKSQVV